jgi:hypothetical protein
MKNQFLEMLDVEKCKSLIAKCREDEVAILCPHYSINIASKYRKSKNPDQLFHDWEKFEEKIGHSMQVSCYDDLIVDVHGVDDL